MNTRDRIKREANVLHGREQGERITVRIGTVGLALLPFGLLAATTDTVFNIVLAGLSAIYPLILFVTTLMIVVVVASKDTKRVTKAQPVPTTRYLDVIVAMAWVATLVAMKWWALAAMIILSYGILYSISRSLKY